MHSRWRVDATRFLFQFEPSGLQSDPDSPAELEVSYEYADCDFDQDGDEDEDEDDRMVERGFDFWHQRRLGGLWAKVATIRIEDLEEVEADHWLLALPVGEQRTKIKPSQVNRLLCGVHPTEHCAHLFCGLTSSSLTGGHGGRARGDTLGCLSARFSGLAIR